MDKSSINSTSLTSTEKVNYLMNSLRKHEALTEDSETVVSVSKLGNRAVRDTEEDSINRRGYYSSVGST